ncbi:thioredoxin domain-containing protein [Collinsella aerofaciens]|uniref:hypothetical protein n=1 Tax=Collinsella aerofaciens TaxID=74426 RepID=UPI0018974DB3|nr:hypothetical protein [Collinsella aerofaciens]
MKSHAASTLPTSSTPDSSIFPASASSRAQSTGPSIPRVRPSSQGSSVLASVKYLDSCHISSCPHMTALARRTGEPVEGSTGTTRDLCLFSQFVPSCA